MIRPANRFRAAALFVLALAGCDDVTAALPAEGPPAAMDFSMGGYGGISRMVTVRGDTVIMRRAPWNRGPDSPVDSVRVVPSNGAWREFWAVVERSGVERWESKYAAENIADGTGWGLRIVTDGATIESHGTNAYPDRRGREHEGSETEEFRAFVDALSTLVGQPLDTWPGGA